VLAYIYRRLHETCQGLTRSIDGLLFMLNYLFVNYYYYIKIFGDELSLKKLWDPLSQNSNYNTVCTSSKVKSSQIFVSITAVSANKVLAPIEIES
jgi:hypothetical protein